jgi:hypothetical protein
MMTRMVLCQCFLGLWFVGARGWSGFLAPSKVLKMETHLALKINLKEEEVVKPHDFKHGPGKNASQHARFNQTREDKPKELMRQEPTTDAKKTIVFETIDVTVPKMRDEEGWMYKKRDVRPKSKSKEGKLIGFMRKFASSKTEIDCVIYCRYGKRTRYSWKNCLQKCVKGVDKRKSLLTMLPEEEQETKALDHEVPPEFQEDLHRISSKYAAQERYSEL